MFEKLKSSSFLIISIVDHLISKRKAKEKILREQYLSLPQPVELEIQFFWIVRRYGNNLKIIVAKNKKQNRLNKKQRALFRQRILLVVTLQ